MLVCTPPCESWPPQLVESVPYRLGPRRQSLPRSAEVRAGSGVLLDVEAVHQFARQFQQEQQGQWLQADRLGGFCLLLKREVLQRLDSLEKWGDLGIFDTDLLSLKVRQAGFTLAVCLDLFVHHFGTRTFAHGGPAEANA